MTSADFFTRFPHHLDIIDFAFIDGHHDYEYAYFDLLSVERKAKQSAIIVMDNATLDGVFSACKTFLDYFPGWKLVEPPRSQDRIYSGQETDHSGTSGAKAEDSSLKDKMKNSLLPRTSSTSLTSFPDVDWFILVGPEHPLLGLTPRQFVSQRFQERSISGFELHFATPACAGTIEYSCCFALWPPNFHINPAGHDVRNAAGSLEVHQGIEHLTVEFPDVLEV